MSRFRAGQKVQLISHKAPWHWSWCVADMPSGHFTFGQTYVIAATETRWLGFWQHLYFVGVRDHGSRWHHPGYLSIYFRAVVEYKTDAGVAVLKKVAADAPARVAEQAAAQQSTAVK